MLKYTLLLSPLILVLFIRYHRYKKFKKCKTIIHTLPDNLINEILSYNIPECQLEKDITRNYLEEKINNFSDHILICKFFNIREYLKDSVNKRNQLVTILRLIKKYDNYQEDYESIITKSIYGYPIIRKSPILLDMCFTECDLPFASSSFNKFNNNIFEDIKTIVKILPSTINSDYGILRCRNFVTPLHASCINPHVPIKVIKFLLDNGANKNHNILLNGEEIGILSDLESNISSYRFAQINELFDLYD